MKAYSQALRNRVIKVHTVDNMKPSKISRLLNIGVNTVYDWIRRFETTGDYSSKQGAGCGPAFRFTDKESILAYLAENPDANGIEIRDAVAPNLPMSTFYDTLARLEITFTASHGKRSGGEETAVAIGSNYRNAMEIIWHTIWRKVIVEGWECFEFHMKFETQITHSPRQDGRGQIACRLFLSFICPWMGKFSHKNSRHYPQTQNLKD